MTRFLPRSALVLFATSALGACATPNFPITTAEAAAPPVLPVAPYAVPAVAREADDMPLAIRPTPAVEARPLDPPPLVLAAQNRRPVRAAPDPEARDEADAAPATRTVTVQDKAVSGRVVEVEGPAATYTVRKGDNLEKIADKLGVDVPELKKLNKLKGAMIHPGQVLKGPPSTSKAYVVGREDNLAAIARRFGVTERALRTENGIGRRGGVHPGQKVRLPEGYRDRGPITVTTKVEVETAAPRGRPRRDRVESTAAEPVPVAETERVEADGARTVVTRSVTGRVVEAEGPPRTYTVRKGDTLEEIADKLDTDVAQLKKDNRLRKSLIHPGQTLKGPSTTAKAYVVGSGDTLFSIGKRFGVTAEALRAENGLSRGGSIHTGQKLRLPPGYRDRGPLVTTERVAPPPPVRIYVPEPPRRTEPPPASAVEETPPQTPPPPSPSPTPPPPATSGGAYSYTPPSTPAPRAYTPPASAPTPQPYTSPPPTPRSYTPASPAPRPYAPPSSTVRPYTPPASAPTPQPYTPPAPTPRPYTPAPPAPRPYTPPSSTVRPYTPPPGSAAGPPLAPQAAAALTDAQISELGRGRFQWPVKGPIISDFGPKTPGQRNDGVNIQANTGDPVRAAAAGDVVYAGDQVPGFGNLVLIKHADGWVTAYGHLSRTEVKMQQKVVQGQEIGLAGATGGVPEPQLHFEVRYAPSPLERARPIDPKLVLPR